MKLVGEFTKFLDEEVNLNKTRIETLQNRVEATHEFLPGSGWGARINRFSPQGSWAHKTFGLRPN